MTFKQAVDHGANVRKGERGARVIFTKPVVFKGEDDEIQKHPMLREYTVFNIAQIDGFTVAEKPRRLHRELARPAAPR
jgi:antirestriction protein ArdC